MNRWIEISHSWQDRAEEAEATIARVKSVLRAWEEDWTGNDTIPSLLWDLNKSLKDTDE
jgi:hypothetical protein